MSRRLFLRIVDDLAQSDPFFTLRYGARGQRGFTTLQKCTTAIRQLEYGTAPDSLNAYLMFERTARECLYKFCEWLVKLYSKKYLRKPNANDVQKLYQAHEERHGFLGMLGMIDCMHWPWQNWPTTWRGVPSSFSDLNVIYQSKNFNDVITGTRPNTSFTVLGVEYRGDYYLADGIYPMYSTIVKTVPALDK
ncbi:uncharacterized protein LOC110875596 [Helianthus annuus]|uniref:uncharacterized protein LOC110875596 n=1 Tax=Helianthus annuus TaxID=4232 RepID=UPI000B909E9D|nr:uncharacterized protein LOC110875596 [Helianthus annuus]